LIRSTEFQELLEAPSPELEAARSRLVTIVQTGERSPIRPTSIDGQPLSFFDQFVKDHLEWGTTLRLLCSFSGSPQAQGQTWSDSKKVDFVSCMHLL
jgi:hypothetical protein